MRHPFRAVVLAGLIATAVSVSAHGQPAPNEHEVMAQIASEVSADQQRMTIAKLVGFGTRHTLSDTKSDTRGIGAARRWVAEEFKSMSRDCGGCLTVETPSAVFTGPRVPNPTEVMDVLAIQRGTTDPNRVIIISGHIDSRVSDVQDFTSDAPGANDDAGRSRCTPH